MRGEWGQFGMKNVRGETGGLLRWEEGVAPFFCRCTDFIILFFSVLSIFSNVLLVVCIY